MKTPSHFDPTLPRTELLNVTFNMESDCILKKYLTSVKKKTNSKSRFRAFRSPEMYFFIISFFFFRPLFVINNHVGFFSPRQQITSHTTWFSLISSPPPLYRSVYNHFYEQNHVFIVILYVASSIYTILYIRRRYIWVPSGSEVIGYVFTLLSTPPPHQEGFVPGGLTHVTRPRRSYTRVHR